ncbi:MAG: ribbon-helix-helix protein, CopG family [Euryarchaeota archaeon]|nr:ribbon-helix-helix protein, CopG family [Euryarchaeota archaeon]
MVYQGDTMAISGKDELETVTAKLTPRLAAEIDALVEEGWYANRSEAIRDAVRNLVDKKNLARLEKAVNEDIEWGLHAK